jgi:light-harvesting protein B-800-850 alpha chain
MIYGKIWCVVKPTVGLPLFLGAVALTSLFVHYQLLGTAGWLKQYYQGNAPAKAAVAEDPMKTAATAPPAATKQ